MNQVHVKMNKKDVMMERTLAIIKPDAVLAKHTGNIIDIIENNDFNILKMYKTQLSKAKAEEFLCSSSWQTIF